jgi:hypothetical protein
MTHIQQMCIYLGQTSLREQRTKYVHLSVISRHLSILSLTYTGTYSVGARKVRLID